jgi:hypothetical protein
MALRGRRLRCVSVSSLSSFNARRPPQRAEAIRRLVGHLCATQGVEAPANVADCFIFRATTTARWPVRLAGRDRFECAHASVASLAAECERYVGGMTTPSLTRACGSCAASATFTLGRGRRTSLRSGPESGYVGSEFDRLSTSESAEAFRTLADRASTSIATVEGAREMLLGSFEILMTRSAQKTNDIVKVLTIITVLLLPSTLIAGVLGMNFHPSFFDTPSLFWVAVGLMIVTMTITLVTIRRRGWLS